MNTNGNRPDGPKGESPREKADDQFPGYPHYPAEDDIMNGQGDNERLNMDVEKLSRENSIRANADHVSPVSPDPAVGDGPVAEAGNPMVAGVARTGAPGSPGDEGRDDMETDADVTQEELELLDRAERGLDNSDDETAPMRAHLDETDEDGDLLNEASGREGMLGADIDVPGAEENTKDDAMGQGDEENDYYSLGSDNNDNVTEGTP
jgi:hypothetical protein